MIVYARSAYTCITYGGYVGFTNLANVHIPMWKRHETQHGRIPINPAIFVAIGHCFIAKTGDLIRFTHRKMVELNDISRVHNTEEG